MKYQEEVKERLHRVDPNEEVFIFYFGKKMFPRIYGHKQAFIGIRTIGALFIPENLSIIQKVWVVSANVFLLLRNF